MYQREAYEATDCQMKDFFDELDEEEFVKVWNDFNIYCPDVQKHSHIL